ncbi:MAG: ABC transporter permease [Blastocatellia bacterium]|nr:ABC transporter permease [Blastocatellia bacterium]
MNDFFQDLRYAFKMLKKNPGFTLVAVLTLALGIGINTAMFSIVNGVLLRPLPYSNPDHLVEISAWWKDFGQGSISQPEYFDLLDRSQSFESLGLYRHWSVNLTEGTGEPERLLGIRITPSVMEALKVPPLLGRGFSPQDGEPGSERVVLLSHGLWQRRFGGDPNIAGRTLLLGGENFRVSGVMPRGFGFPDEAAQLWAAYKLDRANLSQRGNHSNLIIARLKPGVSRDQARAELDIISRDLRKEFPGNYPEGSEFRFHTESYSDTITGEVRPAMLILMGAVGFVLLIACANVANLLLARVTGREKEIAIRAALGAGTLRIVRQLLTESLALSALGGAAALALAWLAFRLLLALQPGDLPRIDEIQLDATVLSFNALLALATGVTFGLLPALKVARVDLQTNLKAGGRTSGGLSRHRTRSLLVVTEVALATVLLISAGLLLRSFQKILAVDPGFKSENILTTQISLDEARYPEREQRVQFYRGLIEELNAQPEIASTGGVSLLPMSGSTSDQSLEAEGFSESRSGQTDFIQYRLATPDYFKTLGIPVLQGRAFTDEDRRGNQNVAIISESLAQKFWGDSDPIGRRIRSGGPADSWFTVVGIVGEIHHSGMAADKPPIWYRPYYQANPWLTMSIVVRTHADPISALDRMRAAVRRLDPQQPIYSTSSMKEMISKSLAQERFNALLLSTFAMLALGLAAIGIYGVISYSVSERTQEIGIRMALGASRQNILKMVIGQGLLLTIIGLGIGLAAALTLTRYIESLLFGVSATDPLTLAAISILLAATSLLACYVPARRATRVDPMIALRYE